MKKAILLLAVCGLVALAFAPVAGAKRAGGVPFQGYLVGQVWFTYDEGSPSPVHLYSDSSGIGDVSHLGATTMTSRHPTPTGDQIAGGIGTWVAANGDTVTFTYDGTAPFPALGKPSVIVAKTAFVVTGGTGRFDAASGSGTMTGYVHFPGELGPGPWPVEWTWNGTIKY